MHKTPLKISQICKALATAISAIFIALAVTSPIIAVTVTKNLSVKTIVVDAGHGGADGGVIGKRTGVKESDLNLKVAKLLGEYLRGGGYRVVYTRRNDTMHTHPRVHDNKKRADMFKRGDIINAASPCAVVSVHMNFYSSASRRGAQVFFDRSRDDGRQFAEIMQSVINREINADNGGREYSALSAEKYLLSCSPYPTVIVECGFLSNPFDEANLVNPDYQALVAHALYLGVEEFLNAA